MAKFEIKYKETQGMSKSYIEKKSIVIADTERDAKDKFFKFNAGYDGIRRPRIYIIDIKEIVEEDGSVTQASNITGPTTIFGSGGNKVDDIYMNLLNLEDYE